MIYPIAFEDPTTMPDVARRLWEAYRTGDEPMRAVTINSGDGPYFAVTTPDFGHHGGHVIFEVYLAETSVEVSDFSEHEADKLLARKFHASARDRADKERFAEAVRAVRESVR